MFGVFVLFFVFLDIPQFAKDMIASVVNRVWASREKPKVGPPVCTVRPYECSFPEPQDIFTNLSARCSSPDSIILGNACIE